MGLLVVLSLMSLFLMILSLVAMVKDTYSFRAYRTIHNAISEWGLDNPNVSEKEFVEMFHSMREYPKPFSRLFDWGYKNILPADKFEVIEPFIR